MEITSVEVEPLNGDGNLLAWVSVVFDEEFLVRNIRLVEANNGVILAMPNEEYKDNLRDVAHPVTSECRDKISEAVIEEYNQKVEPDRRIQ